MSVCDHLTLSIRSYSCSCASSFSFSVLVWQAERLPDSLSKSPSNIILRLLFSWICKNFGRRSKLDKPPEIKESSVIGDAAGLLHVMRHGHDRVTGLEFVNQFLNSRRGDRFERR